MLRHLYHNHTTFNTCEVGVTSALNYELCSSDHHVLSNNVLSHKLPDMYLRGFFSCKRTSTSEPDSSTDQQPSGDAKSPIQAICDNDIEHHMPHNKKQHLTLTEIEEDIMSKSFKVEWETKHPWVTCTDPSQSKSSVAYAKGGEMLLLDQEVVGQAKE